MGIKKLSIFFFITLLIFPITIFLLGSKSYAQKEESFVGCIYKFSGNVEVFYPEKNTWEKVKKYISIKEGNKIRTGKNAFCDIVMQDGSTIRLSEKTEIDITSLKLTNKNQNYKFKINFGKILGLMGKLNSKESSIAINTPTAVMAIRGTDFSVITSTEETNIGLFEGEVNIKTETEEEITLKPDMEALIQKGKKANVQERLSKVMEKEKERWKKVKEYVEGIRKKIQERESYLQERLQEQKSKIEEWEKRREEKLKK
jgi:hypothetical protein